MASMMPSLLVGGMIALAIAGFVALAVQRRRRRRGTGGENREPYGTGNAMNEPNDPQRPRAPELRDIDKPMSTATKAILWTLGIFIGLPVLGVLLLFGYCAVAAR
jgi:uncharacterized protein (TIGR03382 family)